MRFIDCFEIYKKCILSKYFRKRYPLSVTFALTYKCNSRCGYCNIQKFRVREMSTAQIIDAVDEFHAMGTKRIGFVGGEPLLKKDLDKIINHSKEKGIITTLCTNGLLVKKNIGVLKNLDTIIISLDGPKKVHEMMRGRGTFDKVVEAIKEAVREGIEVWTSTVVTKNNIGYFDFILEKSRTMGFKVEFQPVYSYSFSKEAETMLPRREEFGKLIDRIVEAKKQGYQIVASKSLLNYFKTYWPNHDLKFRCLAGRLFCSVSPDGKVYPCQSLEQKIPAVSGVKEGFRKAFARLGEFCCDGCYCDSYIESSMIFSLEQVEPIINAFHNFR